MNPCDSTHPATAPYYREARVTVERRQTACRMRHCFARRIEECHGRRKLGCTPTRWAERHPQGVCRIRKAAEPPTAAQQRMIGAKANRIAASNAATPRYGQCNRQALQLFELLACNVKTFLLGFKGAILFCEREWPPCLVQRLRRCLPPLRARAEKERTSLSRSPLFLFIFCCAEAIIPLPASPSRQRQPSPVRRRNTARSARSASRTSRGTGSWSAGQWRSSSALPRGTRPR